MIHKVERFYRELWEEGNRELLHELCHSDFTFRGSLGFEKTGHDEFWDYVLMVRAGLSDYFCEIEESVSEGNRVFAKMQFGGIHSGTFMGFAPTGKKVTWSGAALFTFINEKISQVWVLGDLTPLLKTLNQNQDEVGKVD